LWYARLALLAAGLLIPAATLVPLGSLWLWEHGYLVYWGLGSCLAVLIVYALQRRLVGPLRDVPLPERAPIDNEAAPDRHWSPRQAQAWEDVLSMAAEAKPERLSSRDEALALALETIERVAKRLHPERRDPLWQFTVPEALAVIERASGALRRFTIATIPLGDRLTVAQLMWLYRWRGAIQLAEKGYDLWRIIRLLNPAAAATQELREQFTRQMYELGRAHLARRLAQAFVKEVGRAAVDLYGGTLRVSSERLAAHVSAASKKDLQSLEARAAEPLRILVAGQTGAGKSSLINALAEAVESAVDVLPTTTSFTAHKLVHEGFPAALIIDSPGVSADAGTHKELIENAAASDLVLWVSAANRAARHVDRKVLDAVRAYFEAMPNRHRPPMLLVLTHIDKLRPAGEWKPPYDLSDGGRAKSASIRGAMEAACAELGFSANETVPVRVGPDASPYNLDALWAKIIDLLPEAQKARLLRCLSDIRSAPGWSALWSQAATAGRVVRDTFLSRNRSNRQ
jgi:predicted GTPase